MLRIGFSLPLCHCLWQWERNLGMRYDCAWCLCFLLLLKQQRQQQRRRCRSSPCHGSVARCCCVGWIFFAALRGTASADERKKATVLAVGHQAQRVCLSVWTPLRQNSKSSTTRHPESEMSEFRILSSQQLVIGFTGKGKCGKGGKGKGKIYLYHTLGKGKGKGSLPTIWQRWQRW